MSASRRTPRIDGDATRVKILEAAGQLFSQSGYAETSSKAVATLAQVDLAAINYHFGGRSGLYHAVLLEGHRRLITLETLQRLQAAPGSAKDKIEQLIDSLVERIYSAHGWPVLVCAREMLSPTAHLEVLMNDGIMPKSAVLRGFVASIIGVPEDDPAVVRCMVSIMAPCLMLLVANGAAPAPFKHMLAMPTKALAEHLKCFTIAGLEGIKLSMNKARASS